VLERIEALEVEKQVIVVDDGEQRAGARLARGSNRSERRSRGEEPSGA
jgi:hypothetical protein